MLIFGLLNGLIYSLRFWFLNLRNERLVFLFRNGWDDVFRFRLFKRWIDIFLFFKRWNDFLRFQLAKSSLDFILRSRLIRVLLQSRIQAGLDWMRLIILKYHHSDIACHKSQWAFDEVIWVLDVESDNWSQFLKFFIGRIYIITSEGFIFDEDISETSLMLASLHVILV